MLSEEQVKKIKKELISGFKSKLPEKEQSLAINQINSMNSSQLEDFLNKNNFTDKTPEIFRLIIEEKIPSTKLYETDKAIAILEINPISEGHTLIVPKKQIKNPNDVSEDIKKFSKEIANILQKKFNPKKVEILSTTMYGEIIINLLPIYKNENMESKRYALSDKEKQKIKIKFKKEVDEEENVSLPKKEKISSEDIWLPKRIP